MPSVSYVHMCDRIMWCVLLLDHWGQKVVQSLMKVNINIPNTYPSKWCSRTRINDNARFIRSLRSVHPLHTSKGGTIQG